MIVEPGNQGISAAQVTLSYPPALLQVEDIRPGDLLGPSPLEINKGALSGPETVTYAVARVGATSVPSPTGTVLIIELRVPDDAPSSRAHLGLELRLTGPVEFTRVDYLTEPLVGSGSIEVQ